MPPDNERRVDYTLVPEDPTQPILYIGSVGDTTGIARQLSKTVTLDSTAMADLPTTAVELVPAPGADLFVIPRYMTLKREGTVEAIDFTTEGYGFVLYAYGAETSGFLSLAFTPNNQPDFSLFSRSGEYLSEALSEAGFNFFTTLPSGLNEARPIANTPLHLYPAILRQGMNLTDAETWAGLAAKLSGDWQLVVTIYYQIVRL